MEGLRWEGGGSGGRRLIPTEWVQGRVEKRDVIFLQGRTNEV